MSKENQSKIIVGGQVNLHVDVEANDPLDAGCMLAVQMLVLPMRDIAKRLPESIRQQMAIGNMVAICVEFGVAYGHEALMAAIKQIQENAIREHELEQAQARQTNGSTQQATTH